MDRGINEVAVTFTNNDYGKGLSDSFVNAFKAMGGSVTAEVPHEGRRRPLLLRLCGGRRMIQRACACACACVGGLL